MAYDGTIIIDTKIDTKGAEDDLKKFSKLLSDKITGKLLDKSIGAIGKTFVKFVATAKNDFTQITALGGGISTVATEVVRHMTQSVTEAKQLFAVLRQSSSLLGSATALAGPIALSLGIAGATVVAAQFFSQLREGAQIYRDLDAAKEHTQAIKDQTAAYRDRIQAIHESVPGDLAQIENQQALAAELDTLVDKTGKVKSGEEDHVRFILSQLNPALEDELSLVNGKVEGYAEQRDAIAKTMEMQRAQILMTAFEEEYTAAIQERQKAYNTAAREKQEWEKKQAKLDAATRENAGSLSQINDLNSRMGNLSEADNDLYKILTGSVWYADYLTLQKAVAEEKAQYDLSLENLHLYNSAKEDYEKAGVEMAAGHYDNVEKLYYSHAQKLALATGMESASLEEQRQLYGQQYADAVYAQKIYLDECLAGNETFNEAEFQQMQDWAVLTKELAEKAGVNIVDGRVEGINGEMINLTDALAGIDETVEKARASQKERSAASAQENSHAYGDSYSEGMEEVPAQVQGAVEDANGQIIDNSKESLDAAIQDADFPDSGKQMMTETAGGAEENADELSEAVTGSITSAHTAAEEAVKNTDFASIGEAIVSAIAAGVGANWSILNNVVTTLIENCAIAGGGKRVYGKSDQKNPASKPRAVGVEWAPHPWVAMGLVSEELMNAKIPNAAEVVAQMQAGVAMNQARVAAEGAPRAMHRIYTTQLAAPAGAAAGPNRVNNYYSVSIDAKNVKEFNDVVKIAQRAVMSYRQGYVDH